MSTRHWIERHLVYPIFQTANNHISAAIAARVPIKWLLTILTRTLFVPTGHVRGVPLKMALPLHPDKIYDAFLRWETREPETLDWIDEMEKDDVFFDIGCNLGTESLYAAKKHNGPDTIIAFDVDLFASFVFSINIALNESRNITFYLLGLSDEDHFQTVSVRSPFAYAPALPKNFPIRHIIPVAALDTFVASQGCCPTHIKIDVDGDEGKIIMGMKQTLHNPRLKSVLVEVRPETQDIVTACLTNAHFQLMKAGQIHSIGDQNQIFYRV